jgi:adenine phosphoribosyltransferase
MNDATPNFSPALEDEVRRLIRDVPDFPKPGIMFKDLTPVFAHGPTFTRLIAELASAFLSVGAEAIAGIEARGFIPGAAVAAELGLGFHLLRKPGKLPSRTVRQSYDLEYGQDALELHEDTVSPGLRLGLVDDLLATGGTMRAALELVRSQGAEVVLVAFVVELGFLGGRKKLPDERVSSVVHF